jgi:hypothetical protein
LRFKPSASLFFSFSSSSCFLVGARVHVKLLFKWHPFCKGISGHPSFQCFCVRVLCVLDNAGSIGILTRQFNRAQ